MQKLKAAISGTEGVAVIDLKTVNPFTPRPSSASLAHKPSGLGLTGKPTDIMAELDSLSHMPDGVDPAQWDRLVAARHRKVESEQRVWRLF